MKSHLLILLFLSLFYSNSFSQIDSQKNWQSTLKQAEIGREFTFDNSKKDNYDSTILIYLGKVKTKDGRVFKIITSRWFWGLSPRATSRIVVFNNNDQYVGNYSVTMTCDLPDKIEKNSLLFSNNKDLCDCDPKIKNRINFFKGLPKKFFLKCTRNGGSFYSFSI